MAPGSKKEPPGREKQSVARRRYWVRMLAECERSAVSQVVFARKRGISVQTLRWWKSRLAREAASPAARRLSKDRKRGRPLDRASFVPVSLLPPEPNGDLASIEVVVAHDRVVRIRGDFDPVLLRKVILTMEPETC